MPVSCFNDSRAVGANRYASSKAVGMSFLERIWLKKFSTTSVKVATSLRKLLNPGLKSFRKSLNEHNDSLRISTLRLLGITKTSFWRTHLPVPLDLRYIEVPLYFCK